MCTRNIPNKQFLESQILPYFGRTFSKGDSSLFKQNERFTCRNLEHDIQENEVFEVILNACVSAWIKSKVIYR